MEWITTLKINDEWQKMKSGDMTVREFSKIIASKLSKLHFSDYISEWIIDEKNDLVNDFKEFAESEDVDIEDFDYLMDCLYDWGGLNIYNGKKMVGKCCWVDTMSQGGC